MIEYVDHLHEHFVDPAATLSSATLSSAALSSATPPSATPPSAAPAPGRVR